MHVLITDSGVGGLSVCAYAERLVRIRGSAEPVRLTFANAAPANDYGYNAMPTREEKLRTFDRFLRSVTERFAPDSIYVACNTLSVLLPDTPFFAGAAIPVRGIVGTGAEILGTELGRDPSSVAIVFGTQTTIDAGTYPRLLAERGIDPARIVSQACPGLADVISEDRAGARSAAEIRRWAGAALARLSGSHVPLLAFLACTHYGYRKEMFAEELRQAGTVPTVIDPNERAAGDLFAPPAEEEGLSREVEVEFMSRYRIPAAAIEALAFFLGPISPRTVEAVREGAHVPDLF
jgi:glutamate racemase